MPVTKMRGGKFIGLVIGVGVFVVNLIVNFVD